MVLQRKSQSVYDVQASGDVEKGSKEADNKAFEQVTTFFELCPVL
jgi:hypothetical protein